MSEDTVWVPLDRRKVRPHVKAFIDANGPGPYLCFFCTKIITEDLDVHHHDGNHENDDPENLKGSHHTCHASHHYRKDSVHSEDSRAKMSLASSLRKRSKETRTKQSESLKEYWRVQSRSDWPAYKGSKA